MISKQPLYLCPSKYTNKEHFEKLPLFKKKKLTKTFFSVLLIQVFLRSGDSRRRANEKTDKVTHKKEKKLNYGEPYLPSPSLCRCIVLKSMRGKVIRHGANKMEKMAKNTTVNTQHRQNKPHT